MNRPTHGGYPYASPPADSAWQPQDGFSASREVAERIAAGGLIPFIETDGSECDNPVESDGEIPEATTAEYQRGFTAGYAKARPLDPGTIHAFDYSGTAEFREGATLLSGVSATNEKMLLSVPTEAIDDIAEHLSLGRPITRDELLKRGFDENLDGAVLDIIRKLGFPTPDAPMGTDATHELTPILPLLEGAEGEPVTDNSFVIFTGIEKMLPIDHIHFDHPHELTPEWLTDAISKPEGDLGAIWANAGTLFARTPDAVVPVPPGSTIHRAVVDQITIERPAPSEGVAAAD